MHSRVIIIGSGPSGVSHTAAIYLARAELKPVLYEGSFTNGMVPGGQLMTTTDVENYPGFPDGISGPVLMEAFRKHSEKYGTQIITDTVSRLDLSCRPFKYWCESQENVCHTADVIIYATGAYARRLHIPGEEIYWQRGISACAVCDGAAPIFRGKILAVVGGGDSAAEEALFLTRYAIKVYVIVRRDRLRASSIMAKRLLNHPKIHIIWDTIVTQSFGDERFLNCLEIKNIKTNGISKLHVSGLFYAIGHEPSTALIRDQVDCDSDGYIITKNGGPETNVKGFFAAGDVHDKKWRQAVTSAGSGCMAALAAERLLAEEE
ncbi:hypothetical protein PCANB_000137 [Pneumocystis canis]|nr:hypothetical protein PCANB_000137 [Pneumocystis canis]